jgi:surface-anchored protein
MKIQPTHHRIALLAVLITCAAFSPQTNAATTLSNGHADVFEVEYEQVGTNQPSLHLGVHTDTAHFEPADVILEVGAAALTPTTALSSGLISLLGESAYILPVDLELAVNLGLLEAGVGRAGFPDSGAPTLTLVAAGSTNPGNFALFTASNAIRLSTTGSAVGANSFSIVSTHIHYNWGFSAPGTYTFDLKASYTDTVFGLLESSTETYTFNVIPEPSSGALLLAGMAAFAAARRRFRRIV